MGGPWSLILGGRGGHLAEGEEFDRVADPRLAGVMPEHVQTFRRRVGFFGPEAGEELELSDIKIKLGVLMHVACGTELGNRIIHGVACTLRNHALFVRSHILATHAQAIQHVLHVTQQLDVFRVVIRPVQQIFLEATVHAGTAPAHLGDDGTGVQADTVGVVLSHGLEEHLHKRHRHLRHDAVRHSPKLLCCVRPGLAGDGVGGDALHLHEQVLDVAVDFGLARGGVEGAKVPASLLSHRVQAESNV
mmetsp:Transcript_62542/g.184969  ORF Transcript_62542/g.184969 Transcript_62542/m.184969 type:complete len:247 (+) Transcript_62542:1040-1780(+)